MQHRFDLTKMPIGSTVWSLRHGKGIMTGIQPEATYPVFVEFRGGVETYTKNGYLHIGHNTPDLYPYPVEVVRKPKTKRLMTAFEAQEFARKLFLSDKIYKVMTMDCKLFERYKWLSPIKLNYENLHINLLVYAEFDTNGNMIGEPQKFEMEE